jgi:hypothetical protein
MCLLDTSSLGLSGPEKLIIKVKSTIILPFGIPKFFRCDNESAMANSTEFHKFMEPIGVQF